MTISLIAACDLNLNIGNKNQLLVKLKNDMKYFKELTQNKIVIMGRKTYESIGHPLPNRINIVLTRDTNYDPHPQVFVYNSVVDLLKDYQHSDENEEVMICGGSEIYHQFIGYSDTIYLTIVNHKFPEADSHFPKLDDTWRCVSNVENKADENNPYDHNFLIYKKK